MLQRRVDCKCTYCIRKVKAYFSRCGFYMLYVKVVCHGEKKHINNIKLHLGECTYMYCIFKLIFLHKCFLDTPFITMEMQTICLIIIKIILEININIMIKVKPQNT